MKIIEEFIKGKNKDQSKCEDIIFKGKRFISVSMALLRNVGVLLMVKQVEEWQRKLFIML